MSWHTAFRKLSFQVSQSLCPAPVFQLPGEGFKWPGFDLPRRYGCHWGLTDVPAVQCGSRSQEACPHPALQPITSVTLGKLFSSPGPSSPIRSFGFCSHGPQKGHQAYLEASLGPQVHPAVTECSVLEGASFLLDDTLLTIGLHPHCRRSHPLASQGVQVQRLLASLGASGCLQGP